MRSQYKSTCPVLRPFAITIPICENIIFIHSLGGSLGPPYSLDNFQVKTEGGHGHPHDYTCHHESCIAMICTVHICRRRTTESNNGIHWTTHNPSGSK